MIFKKNNDIPGSAILGIASGLAVISLLFSLLFWPDSSAMWIIAMGISIALVVYLLVRIQSKDSEKMAHRKFLLSRAVIVLVLSLAFYVIPRSFVLRVLHKDKDEEYLEKFGRSLDHPKNAAYRKEWELYRIRLDSIERAK